MLKHSLQSLAIIISLCLLLMIGSCKKGGDDCQPATTAAAGDDQIIAGTSTTLDANNPTSGVGTWSVVSGAGGTFENEHDAATTFNGTAGTVYTLQWEISGCPKSDDEVAITFVSDPTLVTIDKTSVINGEIITITGFNFSSNYQGNSQIIGRNASSGDTYYPILSRTATEIKAVAIGGGGGATGTYNLVYWKRETAAAGTEFMSDKTITINAAGASQFFAASTLSTNSTTKGSTISTGVKNGGTTMGDYVVKLVSYNFETGVSVEYTATVTGVTADGYGGSMDELSFTIPADIPADTYHVKVTNKGTATVIAGYNQILSVN